MRQLRIYSMKATSMKKHLLYIALGAVAIGLLLSPGCVKFEKPG